MAFVLDISNKRTYVWIYFETRVYLVITKEDNTFAPNQSVSLTNLLKITKDDSIIIPTYISNSGIFKGIVDESSVVQGKYDKNFTLIPGKLMLSSKITFGKTNKGLTKYSTDDVKFHGFGQYINLILYNTHNMGFSQRNIMRIPML